jgi:hypothetical protein
MLMRLMEAGMCVIMVKLMKNLWVGVGVEVARRRGRALERRRPRRWR